MNKNLFISFAVCFIVIFSGKVGAQEITVVKSQEKEVLSNSITLHKVIGHDKEHFFVVRHVGYQYILEKRDRDLNKLAEEPIKLFKGLRTYDLEALVHFHNELYLIVTQRKFDVTVLYYQRIDKTTLLPASELIEISTIEFVRGNWPDFHIALSKKETKLLIASRIKLPLTGAQFNEFYVFAENFDIVWKRKDTYEYKGQGPRDNTYMVDEYGNVSILSLLKRESLLSLFRDFRNMYSIYRYTHEGNDFFEYLVTLNENYIRGIKIIAGENGDLICAGLWSELFRSGIRGTFFFKIDAATATIFDHVLNKFDDAVLEELGANKEPMINEEELISYVISDIVLRDQGKCIVIAEQIFRQNYNTYNNLIVSSLESNGQVYWTRVIPKKQNFSFNTLQTTGIDLVNFRDFVRETGFYDPIREHLCSYALMAPVERSGIVLFFNDDIRNMNGSENPKPFGIPRKSYLLAVSIDEFGNILRIPLIPWKKRALFPAPVRYYDTLGEEIIIPAFRNRSVGYYRITAPAIP